jgi:Na+-translocating ferredoxin:NAD+ oxidoreductase subunit B
VKRAAVAVVDEARCIGCVLCIEACPVDAIVGAQGMLHTVVEDWCIGCELCVAPCPVDCIAMVAPQGAWTPALKQAAGERARRRRSRLAGQGFDSFGEEERKAILARLLGEP